eukprot:4563297-Prymnesium_polylepis.1
MRIKTPRIWAFEGKSPRARVSYCLSERAQKRWQAGRHLGGLPPPPGIAPDHSSSAGWRRFLPADLDHEAVRCETSGSRPWMERAGAADRLALRASVVDVRLLACRGDASRPRSTWST